MRKLAILLGLLVTVNSLESCKKSDTADSAPQTTRVTTMRVDTTQITTSRTYSGTVVESSGTTLSFPVSGTLQSLAVSEGDHVYKGQLIATLDQSTLKNSYDIAKATLDEAQDAYDRMKQLHDAHSLPDMQWVEVQNTLKQAQSAEAIARKALRDGCLYSPVAGYVSERFAEPGMTIAPIAPIVKIVTINPIKVSISIPENEIAPIKEGQEAIISVGAIEGKNYTGKVTEKGVAANPITRAYDVKISVPNPDSQLLPGMICDVMLDNPTPRQAIILPTAAVLLDADNTNFVWLDKQGKAVKRQVKVEGISDDGIIITDGIVAGDSIIVEGQQKVSQGMPVTAINAIK